MKLWTNATFYTMDNNHVTNKVLTKNGLIIALGSDVDNYKVSEVIDLSNNFVFPGFSESHIHLIGYGRKLLANNLNLIKDKELVIKELTKFYNNQTLRVEGYFNIGITKSDLDNITNKDYLILRHNDYHSFTVNTKVLTDLKIESIDGIITDEALTRLIKPLWEDNSKETLIKMTELAINKLKSLGYTSVHTDDLSYFNSYDETLNILDEQSQKHQFRINTLIHYNILDSYERYFIKDNKYLSDIQIKVFYDGTLSSKTAYLKENYLNTTSNGTKMFSDLEFTKLIEKSRSINKGIAVHTIGDKALEEVVKHLSKYPNSKELDRIIHGSLSQVNINLNNIPIDIQPLFKISDKETIEKNIIHDVLVYPFDKYNKETIINSSSDAPVEDPNPLLTLYHLDDISRYDAIKSYTVNPYLTINKKGGMIKEGYYADFTVFDKDIMKIDKEELLNTNIKYTIINETINIY